MSRRVIWTGNGPDANVSVNMTKTHVEFVPERRVDAWRLARRTAIRMARNILKHYGEKQ